MPYAKAIIAHRKEYGCARLNRTIIGVHTIKAVAGSFMGGLWRRRISDSAGLRAYEE
jgi:hypothetical protein